VGLFYDQARIPDGPKTYADMWNLQKWPGKRLLRAGPKMTLEIALMADGVAPAEVYKVLATKEGQDRAFAKLDQIKPELEWWSAGTQPLQLVGSGEVAMAVGYIGRTANAAAEGARYPLLWNTLLYSYDSWTVVKGSPNQEEAMKFLDFITDPAPLTALARHWAISPSTRQVIDDPAVRARNPAMIANHQAEGLFINTEFWAEHGEDLEKRFAVWSGK
jgi:putative spermidine/putrescine transport system substrate-binding protein